ncbi:unnamed protein product [Boreogadus saida]
MKRSYESGSHKKKKKDQRQDFLSKLPSFFTATAVAAGPSEDQEQPSTSFAVTLLLLSFQVALAQAASSDANDVCQQTDGDDAQLCVAGTGLDAWTPLMDNRPEPLHHFNMMYMYLPVCQLRHPLHS